MNLVTTVFSEVVSDSESEPASDDDADDEQMNLVEASTMSRSALNKTLGDEQAAEVAAVFFQHAAIQTAPAHHLKVSELLTYSAGERSAPQAWRKGQLHPTVYYRLIEGIMNASNFKMQPSEAMVQVLAGTQEAVVAAIAHGMKQVGRAEIVSLPLWGGVLSVERTMRALLLQRLLRMLLFALVAACANMAMVVLSSCGVRGKLSSFQVVSVASLLPSHCHQRWPSSASTHRLTL